MSTAVEGKPEKSNNQESDSRPPTQEQGQPSLTKDWKHTLWYVGGAAAFLAITGLAEFAGRPAAIEDFGKVGQEFYAEFVDPTAATSLEVFVFDTENVRPVDFRVERNADKRWVIPSHHNYPADAEEQLAKTASSIIGISRGAMVTRWPADHGRYGVVNPKQDSLTVDEVDGVGQRIILRKEDDSVLADYIIGKQVEGESDQYYVRHPGEDDVYITTLDIDLSTKFTDWIDTDLFDFSNGEILQLTINDYSFDELNGSLTKGDVTTLTRDKTWSDDWKLDSLNEETEELDKDAIRESLNAVADLKIAGVRPKQKGLTPDLQLDRESLRSQQGVDRLQQDLMARGFLLQPGGNDGTLSLISREGELYAGTDDGLLYRMHFGRVFTGSQEELEIGFASSESGSGDTDASADDADSSEEGKSESETDGDAKDESTQGDESTQDEAEAETGNKPGRYLFVRVEFDKAILGEPMKPVEPEKSAALLEAEKAEAENAAGSADEKEDETESGDSTKSEDEEPAGDSTDESEKESEKESEVEKLREEFQQAKDKYQDDLKAYEEFQQKVTDGQEKAKELNRRFADWYYVIPGESFDKLKLDRQALVKEKEEEEEEDSAETGEDPSTSDPSVEVEPADGDLEAATVSESDTEETVAEPEAASDSESDTEETDAAVDSVETEEANNDPATG